MAQYNIPYQNLTFDVPDAGEVYRIEGDPTGSVYFRSPTDNKIYGTNIEVLGSKALESKGVNASTAQASQRFQAGLDILKSYGIDFNTLKTRTASNQADISSVLQSGGAITDLNLLKSTPTQTGETITKSISTSNPQGADVTSSLYGSLEKSKSLMENLLNAGATQQQAQSLTGSAQAGKPFTAQNLTTAGVTAPKPVPTTAMTPYTVSRGTATSTNLPSTTSIVDFLDAQGIDSSRTARKAMYEKLGLTDRLGEYVGSAQQNTRLLEILRNQGTSTVQNQTTEEQKDSATKATTGTSASDLFPGLFSNSSSTAKSEAELVNDWLNSAEGKLFLEKQNLTGLTEKAKAEQTKKELEAKYAQEKSSLENKLADNGLAFSGIRGTEVKAIADALASSTLSVDRELASKLLDANLDLREAILKGVADLAKDAEAGRKEAIQQLNAIGYAVVGGKLVPTLAAQSGARAEASLQMSERRLQLSEEAATRAEQRFEQLYGKEKINSFQKMRELVQKNPTATEADLESTIRSNPDIFGNPNETEIKSAISLIGIPASLQSTIAKSYIESFDTWLTSREDAKTKAKEALRATGGTIIVKQGTGQRTYNLTTDQLDELIKQIDLVD